MSQANGNAMTRVEETELAQHEQIIERGLRTFFEVGTALKAIRDGRLYRQTHETFEDYCRERWDMTKSKANYLVSSAKVMAALDDNNCCQKPATESQCRPLAKLLDQGGEEIASCWADIVKSAPTNGDGKPHITAKHVDQVVQTRIKEFAIPLPDEPGKYRVIYGDPPWRYNDKCEAGAIQAGGCERHYSTMAIDELCELPVKDLAMDNSVLFLWSTTPLLPDAWHVMRSWGFAYKSNFCWNKVKHNCGHYNSVRHETLLVGTRGSCLPDSKKLLNSVVTIERREHSRKPDEFYTLIESMYERGPYLELFARRTRPGWNAWGDEISRAYGIEALKQREAV